MTEIKPWQDRVKPGAFTGVKMEAMLAEIAELRARLAQQAEMVEKCMVAMNENADRGMKAEQERDELRAALAKSQPVEQGEPVAYQFRWINPAGDIYQKFSEWEEPEPRTGQTMQEKCAELRAYRYAGKPCYEVRALFTHPVRPMSDEDIDDLHDVAARAFRRHQLSVRGQQITPQDGFEWHFARAIEAHIKGETK